MDLYRALQDLYAEKEKLERAIESLEQLQRAERGVPPPVDPNTKRRGRKSMSSEEREEVSQRMKRYWAARRGASVSHGNRLPTPARKIAVSNSFKTEPLCLVCSIQVKTSVTD